MRDVAAARERSRNEFDCVLHEPPRLSILGQPHIVEMADFLFMIQQTGLTQGNLFSHMSKLEEAGYGDGQKEFVTTRWRMPLRLADDGREAFKGVTLCHEMGLTERGACGRRDQEFCKASLLSAPFMETREASEP